jgi:hypothetical protein
MNKKISILKKNIHYILYMSGVIKIKIKFLTYNTESETYCVNN